LRPRAGLVEELLALLKQAGHALALLRADDPKIILDLPEPLNMPASLLQMALDRLLQLLVASGAGDLRQCRDELCFGAVEILALMRETSLSVASATAAPLCLWV
jgi:hypothetical protein